MLVLHERPISFIVFKLTAPICFLFCNIIIPTLFSSNPLTGGSWGPICRLEWRPNYSKFVLWNQITQLFYFYDETLFNQLVDYRINFYCMIHISPPLEKQITNSIFCIVHLHLDYPNKHIDFQCLEYTILVLSNLIFLVFGFIPWPSFFPN